MCKIFWVASSPLIVTCFIAYFKKQNAVIVLTTSDNMLIALQRAISQNIHVLEHYCSTLIGPVLTPFSHLYEEKKIRKKHQMLQLHGAAAIVLLSTQDSRFIEHCMFYVQYVSFKITFYILARGIVLVIFQSSTFQTSNRNKTKIK